MKRHAVLLVALLLAGCGARGPTAPGATTADEPPGQLTPPPLDFSQFHGFNLLGKFILGAFNDGYHEEDFRLVSELGYNFVRLPVDYRTYVAEDDWLRFDEASLGQIDEAIELGQKYGVHVCLNLHRGPGYTVAQPPEATSLWEDPATQRAFLQHWAMFAQRYASVPREALSFNLLNEPAHVDAAGYATVMRPVIEAIRAESPGRPVMVDGLDYGQKPVLELSDLGLVQATRGYTPFGLTHYKASWVGGAEDWPEPEWPPPAPSFASHLYGPAKPEYRSKLEIRHEFEAGSRLFITVHQVSSRATLQVRASGALLLEEAFEPGPGEGPWSEVRYSKQWGVYQNIYDKTLIVELPRAGSITLEVTEGDWLTLSKLMLEQGERRFEFEPSERAWGARQRPVQITEQGELLVVGERSHEPGRATLMDYYQPWLEYRQAGGRIFVGEFGAFNKTPHTVVLAWLEDLLAIYKEHDLGWALWNLRGSFGVINSGRTDVKYETFGQAKLDREMLTLLDSAR